MLMFLTTPTTADVGTLADASLVAWGHNEYGQCNFPTGNSYSHVIGGSAFALAVLSNGSLAGWGWNGYDQCDVPTGSNYVQIAAGHLHGLALRSDGSLVAWGDNGSGQWLRCQSRPSGRGRPRPGSDL